jgi:hypothetical protein
MLFYDHYHYKKLFFNTPEPKKQNLKLHACSESGNEESSLLALEKNIDSKIG